MQSTLFWTGSVAIFLWGIGHLIPTRNVVAGFGELSPDNRRIITMEWIAEGLTLCFAGALTGFFVFALGAEHAATHLAARASAVMLMILAAVSAFTGARTAILPMKLCPYIKTTVAVLFIVATCL